MSLTQPKEIQTRKMIKYRPVSYFHEVYQEEREDRERKKVWKLFFLFSTFFLSLPLVWNCYQFQTLWREEEERGEGETNKKVDDYLSRLFKWLAHPHRPTSLLEGPSLSKKTGDFFPEKNKKGRELFQNSSPSPHLDVYLRMSDFLSKNVWRRRKATCKFTLIFCFGYNSVDY